MKMIEVIIMMKVVVMMMVKIMMTIVIVVVERNDGPALRYFYSQMNEYIIC